MTPNFLNQLRSQISSPLISMFCKKYEENDALLKKTIDTSICTVLIGLNSIKDNTILYNKVIESITLTEFFNSLEYDNGKLSSINYSFEHEGLVALNLIFSNKKGRISEMISNEIGVKSGTAGAVLNFAVMLILSNFKNETDGAVIEENLNSDKKGLLSIIPEGIRIILGYPNFEYEDAHYTADSITKTNLKTHFFNKIFKQS